MDICTMELSAFLFFVIFIPWTANETMMNNIGVFLYSIFIRFLRYILYNQDHHVMEQNIVKTLEEQRSILQKAQITPQDTLDNGSPILKTSTPPIQDFSSTKNYLTKDTPVVGFTITSCSTETDDAYPFLQDASSETSKVLAKLLQETGTSRDSFTKENGKGLEIPVTFTGLSENEPQNYSVTEIPVKTQSVCAVERKVKGDAKIFTIAKSEEVVQYSLDGLESSINAISTLPCPVTKGTNNDSLQFGTNHTELAVGTGQTCEIKDTLSVEVGYSSRNATSRNPVTFTRLSENEPQNYSVMEIPVSTQSVCAVERKVKEGDDEIFTIAKSEEVVKFSLNGLESSIVDISTCPCLVTEEARQVGTDDTELVGASQTCEIKETLSVEVGYSSHNASSRDMTPELLAGDASDNECETGNIIKERDMYEISPTKRRSLSTVPMEFLYPCLPYFNP